MAGDTRAWRRDEIRPVKRRVEDAFLDLPGVVGVDIAEKRVAGLPSGVLAISVSVLDKRPADRLPAWQLLPREVEGVPVDVVRDDVLLHTALMRADSAPEPPPEAYSTLLGGISIGPCRPIRLGPPQAPEYGEYVTVGTLGLLVTDLLGSGEVLGLTSFHVACVDDGWTIGDELTHPSRVDGGRCPDDVCGSLARGAFSSKVDGALIRFRQGRPIEPSIVGIGPVTGHAAARIGAPVRKRGRSTGLTAGVVVSVDATVQLDYGAGLGVRRMRDQVRIEVAAGRFGDRGDSGAAVVDQSGRVVGLHFAGNQGGTVGYANPIEPVLAELVVGVCTG
ncbi:chymotrypsin family serine protease [Allokutzneria albata]|uniref:Trypsin-like peptidase domain-containing protein n=1 Tax=Allokutzneria albata TaxID=211114 RepID=A0A1G9Z5N8_ALLAB|nr:hypothetical protein [Allokutzneria albata]SDN16858.1 hypothetical protein SAMN04489726_5296 [Allokutzneria albata]